MNFEEQIVWAGKTLAISELDLATSNLPWRKWRTPYRVFLAEMLLIRTRADVVGRIYEDVFEKYPTVQVLSQANEDELSELLRPLGLAKRVPYIIRAARHICDMHNGEIPYNIKELLEIPGIGMYTAVAEATFAYGRPLVPTDVNILRFIARLTGLEMEHRTKGSNTLRDLTVFLGETYTQLPAEKLLDFTRLICRPRTPLCEKCPLTIHCEYSQVDKHETNID